MRRKTLPCTCIGRRRRRRRSPRDYVGRAVCACGTSLVRWMALQCAKRTARRLLWYFLSPLDGASVRLAHCAQASTAVRRTEAPCAQASTAVRFSARSALRAGYWPTCLTDGHMVVNDHTRSAENWKCVTCGTSFVRYRMYVDSHSLGQLALASKRIS